MDEKLLKQLKSELKIHARAVGIPEGSAKAFIDQAIIAAKKGLTKQSSITNQDLVRLITKQLSKYNSDLAYAYKNHDKIL